MQIPTEEIKSDLQIGKRRGNKTRQQSLYIFLLLLLLVRLIIFFAGKEKIPDGTHVRLTQRVSSEPIRYDDAQYLKLHNLKIYLPLYPEVNYGDSLVVEGVVIGDKLTQPKLIKVYESTNKLISLRKKLITFYRNNLSEPHASLIAGITIGSKSQIPKNFWEKLKQTGTAHVVVASGMNVSLVASFIVSVLILFTSRTKAVYIATIFIWIYTFISGFDAPLVRAAVMASIAYLGVAWGRVIFAQRTLIATAYIMLLYNPGWLIDLGFILSFVATLCLLLFSKRVDRALHFLPTIFREGVATSLAAQIGVAPILFVTFGQFNPLSPIINGLVLWLIGPLTVLSLGAGIIGLVIPSVGRAILFLTYPLSLWFVGVVNLF